MVGRLFQIVYLLMENERMSAKELSDRLEVSVRTINRDIEKLSEARIPVYSSRGREGGFSLLPDFVLNKTVLSDEEKSGILSSMRLMGTVAYDDEKEALKRLEEFFGKASQDWIEIELDNWSDGFFDKERFKQIKNAVLSRKKIEFDYARYPEVSHRKVRPCKLVFRSQAWYLYAYCEARNDFRYFKFHRMKNLVITEEHFDAMTLPAEENHYISKEPSFAAVLAIDKSMAYRAFDELSSENVVEEDNRYIFKIENASDSWFISYVLSYGSKAEVLSPVECRNTIADIVNELEKKYNMSSEVLLTDVETVTKIHLTKQLG